MELDSKNMKKILIIVAFGIILYMSLQNFDIISNNFQNFTNILSPFILGACIAFVVNIPMKFIENKLLNRNNKRKTRYVRKVGENEQLVENERFF